MCSDIVIAKAEIDHLERIEEIENGCFTVDKFSRKQFAYLLTKSKADFYVAYIDGSISAYIVLLKSLKCKHLRLYSIAVDNEKRGRGLAGSLIDLAKMIAKSQNYKSIRLEVRKSNMPAIELYYKNGFQIRTLKKNYYPDGEDGLSLEWNNGNT